MTDQVHLKRIRFTHVITKNKVPALIQTATNLIKGQIYLYPNIRLLDELNRVERFIPVTQAVVFGPDGKELYRARFMSLQSSHIVWILPEEEYSQSSSQQDGAETRVENDDR